MKVKEVINWGNKQLESVFNTEANIESKLLLEEILNVDRAKLLMMYDEDIKIKDLTDYRKMINKRMRHMPIAYITGHKKFMGYDFKVRKGVLIPRDDTEVLVRETCNYVNQKIKNKNINIIDVCSGSGCISVSLAKLIKNSNIIGLDISYIAINMSKKNKKLNNADNVKYIKSNLFKAINSNKYYNLFDIIVSNPPYIKTDIVDTLESDVRDFEPRLALDGGNDGLIFYKKIIKESKKYLKEDGMVAFEIDYTYTDDIKKEFENNNYIEIKVIKDLSGKDRVIIAKNNEKE